MSESGFEQVKRGIEVGGHDGVEWKTTVSGLLGGETQQIDAASVKAGVKPTGGSIFGGGRFRPFG